MMHVNYVLAGKPPAPRQVPRRTVHSAVTALLIVLFSAGAGWLLWQSYRETQDSVRLKATAYSNVVATNVEWVMAKARQVQLIKSPE